MLTTFPGLMRSPSRRRGADTRQSKHPRSRGRHGSCLGGLLDSYQPATRPAEPPPRDAAVPPWPALTVQSGSLALPAPNARTVSGMGTGDFLRVAAVTAAVITKGDESDHENRTDRAII